MGKRSEVPVNESAASCVELIAPGRTGGCHCSSLWCRRGNVIPLAG